MAFTGDKHVFSNGDAAIAEAVQEIHDQHDAFVDVFNAQHRGSYALVRQIGEHAMPQVGAFLVLNTPEGIGIRKRPVSALVQLGIDEVSFLGTAVQVRLQRYLSPIGAKAWVASRYAGGPLSGEEMNYLTPPVFQMTDQFADSYRIDFGSFLNSATVDEIRKVYAVWYTWN